MPEEEKFKVGVVIGFHGLAGVMKVRPGTNNPALLLDLETVTVVTGKNEELPCNVLSLRIEKGNLLLGVDAIGDRTQAETFMGSEVYTDRCQLADLDENEFWTGDLIGLEVYTTAGVHVGTVCDIINGAGDLLEIRKAGGTADDTALVPFVKALVPVVDIKGRRIEITDLPGLID
jgi:16S rRNA processing protein RimM